MTSCDNCIHFPVCNIRDDYRQLLIDIEPFRKKNPAFEAMVYCNYFRIDTKITTRRNEATKPI